jgi:hypothetical protein
MYHIHLACRSILKKNCIQHSNKDVKCCRKGKLLLGKSLSPKVTLLRDGEFDTLALGKRYPGLDTVANDENIRYPVHNER